MAASGTSQQHATDAGSPPSVQLDDLYGRHIKTQAELLQGYEDARAGDGDGNGGASESKAGDASNWFDLLLDDPLGRDNLSRLAAATASSHGTSDMGQLAGEFVAAGGQVKQARRVAPYVAEFTQTTLLHCSSRCSLRLCHSLHHKHRPTASLCVLLTMSSQFPSGASTEHRCGQQQTQLLPPCYMPLTVPSASRVPPGATPCAVGLAAHQRAPS